ncbi:alkylation response protein AidB-like acyl-CoA dehydrogenase [Ancylobacter sp. 3268]|uniref:acyl-CoA dehydrogenase family protein n=1 Tax=Ancylobacter sp. 3268 TaxID=2817752 RepID=UPI0028636C14|nr:acyl-CoA dehydrogenase family protein [Ancylobacter sp. 3268]MDR6951162.1 alkylation response protein AidB-like acyl-CoA dehydrogenase [Ancylobacter sp. 3268]
MNQTVSTVSADPASIRPGSPEFEKLVELIAADASRRDQERIHPHDVIELLGRARLGALRLPVAEGGGGGTLRDVIGLALRLGEADTNVAHIYRNHFTFVERFLIGNTEARSRRWRDAVLNGAVFGLASTELDRKQTGGASDFHTALTEDGDGYRLNGTKYYSTGTLYAEWLLVRATATGSRPVSIVIPTAREGIERVDDWDGIGQRVTGTGTTNFHNVRIEADEVIFDRDNPSFLMPYTSTIAQIFVTAVNAGVIRAVLRDAKALLKSRNRTFYFAAADRTVDDPLLLQTIGRIASDAFAAELVVLAAADALDKVADARSSGNGLDELAHEAALTSAKAKVIVDELSLRSANALFDVGGASAATRRKNLDRHWRNARTLSSHNPASYKAQAIGGYEINGTRLPSLGFF